MLTLTGTLVQFAPGFVTLALAGADAAAARGAARGRGRAPFTERGGGALDVRITLRRHRDFFAAALGRAAPGAAVRATVRARGWMFREPGFGSTAGVAFDLTAVSIDGAVDSTAVDDNAGDDIAELDIESRLDRVRFG